MKNKDELKLVYILKIGYNSKNEGLYEFIFSDDIDSIIENYEEFNWHCRPANQASDPAQPPSEEYITEIRELKTNKFDLFCLHDSDIYGYIDGLRTIHCIAYEIEDEEEDFESYESMFSGDDDDTPLLVFHFGTTLSQVEEMLYERDIVFKSKK